MPAVKALNDVLAFLPSATLQHVAKLGVADQLKNGPESADELAKELGELDDTPQLFFARCSIPG